MRLAYCTAILLLAAGAALSAPEDIEISGIVVDSSTGKPIRHARVTARGWDKTRNVATEILANLSGEDGKFRFVGLPQDAIYGVDVTKAGYFPDPYDKKTDLKSSTTVTLHMIHMVALTVTVRDVSGFPVAGADIAIAGQGNDSFERPIRQSMSSRSPTNVDGTFRTTLFPGRYRFSVIAPANGGFTFVPVYYPGTEDLKQAESIDLRSGEDVTTEIRVTRVPAREIHVHLAVEGRLDSFWASGTLGGLRGDQWGIVKYEEGSRDIVVSGLAPGAYALNFDVATSIRHQYTKAVQVGENLVTNVELSTADLVH